MVKRSVKYSLGLLAFLMIALLVTPFFIDVNTYKSQITEAVEDATGRTLKIGNIEASLFPWVGVRLEDVHLANHPEFNDRDFLKVGSLDIQLALLPLFSKEIEIKQFVLDSPEVFLERNAAGDGNWEDLTASEPGLIDGDIPVVDKDAEKDRSSSVLAALNAEFLQMKHGRFSWVDRKTQQHIELSDMKIEVNDVQMDRPIEMKASGRVGADEIALTAQIGPVGDIAKLDIDKLPLQINLQSESFNLKPFVDWLPEFPAFLGRAEDAHVRLNVQLEQRPDGMRLSVGEAALLADATAGVKWKVEMPNAKKIKLQELGVNINGQKLLNAQGEIRLGGKHRYQLRVKGESVKRSWLASLIPELNTMYAGHASPWQTLKLGAVIAGDVERLELRDVQLMLDQELLQVSGVASFNKAPDIRLRLTSKELHLDPWLPKPKQKKSAPASVQSELASVSAKSQEPDLRSFKTWRISSQIQIEKLHLSGLEMDHLRATLNGSRGLFKLDPLRFDLAGGQVREKATLNIATYPARWTESVRLSGVNIGPVLKTLAGIDMLEGVLQMDTDIKATGLLPEGSLKSLNGQGKVLLRDGSVKGFDIAGILRNLTSFGKTTGPQKTDFAQLSGKFNIKNGMVKNDDLFMASPLFRLTGRGLVNLPKSTMDYHVKPRLVGTLTGQGDTVTVRKGLSVPLHIHGPLASPRVTPEVDPATLIENIGAIRGGGAGNILKGLKESITGPDNTTDKKPTEPAQQEKPSPEKDIQKVLEGLIPGF